MGVNETVVYFFDESSIEGIHFSLSFFSGNEEYRNIINKTFRTKEGCQRQKRIVVAFIEVCQFFSPLQSLGVLQMPISEYKLCVFGSGGVGKSCLVR